METSYRYSPHSDFIVGIVQTHTHTHTYTPTSLTRVWIDYTLTMGENICSYMMRQFNVSAETFNAFQPHKHTRVSNWLLGLYTQTHTDTQTLSCTAPECF